MEAVVIVCTCILFFFGGGGLTKKGLAERMTWRALPLIILCNFAFKVFGF